MTKHHAYWDGFYASRVSNAVPLEPSAFARWVHGRIVPGQMVAEFGFGNARDSLWFARQGHTVTGYDFADSAVDQARGRAHGEDLGADFSQLDLYDRDSSDLVAKVLATGYRPMSIYGRFLIHALEEPGRHNLLDLAAVALADGGDLFLEFRTGQDEATKHVFGEDHYRVYLDPRLVIEELESRGARVVHSESGHGLAVYKSEDPHVARLVARWS
jgi:SAM-dependent methyltransferase